MKRGESSNEDELLKIKLKNSIKDFTENIMITDLVRNDLSVNAKRGSVKVEDLCQVYTFDKIHQMITTISSCIEDETHFCDVLKATFPMGSMTGAPKINSMKLIDFFEEFRRGDSGRFIVTEAVEKLIEKTNSKFVLLSYGSTGKLTLDEIMDSIRQSGYEYRTTTREQTANVMASMTWTDEWTGQHTSGNKNTEHLILVAKEGFSSQ